MKLYHYLANGYRRLKNTKKINIVPSSEPNTDTFVCPECKAIWRAKGEFDWELLGTWTYHDEDYCPVGCTGIFGRVKGKIVEKESQ